MTYEEVQWAVDYGRADMPPPDDNWTLDESVSRWRVKHYNDRREGLPPAILLRRVLRTTPWSEVS